MKVIVLAFLFLGFISQANAQRYHGYSLIAKSNQSSATLIDTNGTVFKTFSNLTGSNGYSSYMMPGGYLWRTVKTTTQISGGGIHGRVQKVDWNGNILWDYTYSSSTYVLHHDICPLPNGNVLLISYDVKPAGSVTAAGGTFTGSVQFEKIIEVQPTGVNTQNIVWEWYLWDHMCQSADPNKPNYVTSIVNNPQLLNMAKVTSSDFCHMNGIDYDATTDQIIFSSHFLNEIFVIDHSTTTAQAASHTGGTSGKGGDFLFRWGNPANYGATGTKIINTVHDAHFVQKGPRKGQMGYFNNQGISNTSSCADYFTPPFVGGVYTITAGSAYAPSTYGYRLNPGMYSSNMSNTEEYPNGNIMVASALQSTFKEYDASGNLLWTYNAGGQFAQVHRYAPCDLSAAPPTQPNITLNGTDLSVTAVNGLTYTWYRNDTAQSSFSGNTYAAGSNYGGYYVVVADTFGCEATSPVYNYWPTSVSDVKDNNKFSVYPNPAKNTLFVKTLNNTIQQYELLVRDMNGKIMASGKNLSTIDLSNYAEGLYQVSFYQNNKVVYQTQFNHVK